MPSIHEILLAVTGDADDARRELASVTRDLSEFSREDATAEISLAGVARARAELAEIKHQLDEVDRDKVRPEMAIRIDQALASVNTLDRRLGSFWADEMNRRKRGDQLFDPDAFNSEQQRLVSEVTAFGARIQAVIQSLGRGGGIEIPVDLEGVHIAEAEAERLKLRLEEISHERVSPEVRVQIAQALVELELVKRKAAEVRREANLGGGFVAPAALQGLFSAFQTAARGAEELVGEVGHLTEGGSRLGAVMAQAGSTLQSVFGDDGLGKFAGKTRDIQEAVVAVAVIILSALIPAIIALAGSLSAAIIGAGGLATAFVAALGPAALLLFAVFQRLHAILAAKQALDQQGVHSSRDSANAAKQAAQAEEQRRQAVQALGAAQRGIVGAERQLQEARRQAAAELRRATLDERAATAAVAEAAHDVAKAHADVARARQEAHRQIIAADQREADSGRALAEARRQAARSLEDSTRRLADAQDQLRQATTDAYRAWADAIETVHDDLLAVEDAQLGIADAQLNVEEAQLRVNEALAKTPGLAQQVFSVLQKLQDVDLGPDAFAGIAQQIGTVGGSGGDQNRQVLDLRRALLDLARAKLGVKEADDRLSDSNRKLAEDQQTLNNFTQSGIAAYKPYADALRGVADAERAVADTERQNAQSIQQAARTYRQAADEARRLRQQGISQSPAVLGAIEQEHNARKRLADAQVRQSEAERKLAELRQRGIANAPGVLSATDQLAAAHDRLEDAQHRVATAGSQAFATLPGDINKSQAALGKLSNAERVFLSTIFGAGTAIRQAIGPATDLLFNALSRAFVILQPLLGNLGGMFVGIARIWARSIESGARSLVAPAWQNALRVIFAGSQRLAGPVLQGLGSLLVIFRNLAVAIMPALVSLFQGAARGLASLAARTNDVGGLRAVFAPLIDATRAWLGLVGALARVFLAFALAVGPAGTGIVRWLTQGAKALADWLRSGKGMRDIQQFFRDTLPLAKQVVTFLIQFGIFLARVFQLIAPSLALAFQMLNALFFVVNGLLNVIVAIVNPITQFAGMLAQGALFAGTLTAGAQLLAFVLGGVADAIRIVLGFFGQLVSAIVRPFVRAVNAVKNFLGIGSPSRVFLGIGMDIVRGLVLGIARLAGLPVTALVGLVRRAIGGVRGLGGVAHAVGSFVVQRLGSGAGAMLGFFVGVARRLFNGFVSVFRGLGGAIASIFGSVVNLARNTLNAVIGVINAAIRGINRITPGAINVGPVHIPGLPDIPQIPRLAGGGLAVRRTLAELGEAGREAVLPLTQSVMAELAQALAAQLQPTRPGVAGGGPLAGGDLHQHFHVPPSPAAHGQPDSRVTAANLAREMRKRAPAPA